ncbi:MAG: hypothetical protein MUF43_14790 [Flavobacterium sp.]|jgi:hypothetical protein|nr:hypothetical protein [Flavobacterium sp.]
MTAKQLQQILSEIYPVSIQTAEDLLPYTSTKSCLKGDMIEKSGTKTEFQFIVLEGVVRKFIINDNADEFTIGFFTKGQAITPAITRSSKFISFVNLEIISNEADILIFENVAMEQKMSKNQDLKEFGNHVLMQDALERAEREIVILKGSGIEKLNWFREIYPNLENQIPHYYIASFLGLTNTSLSRVRKRMFK